MNNHQFSIQVTAYGKTVTISQVEDAVDIHEFLDMCRALAIGIGYHEESWEDGVVQMAESYTDPAEDKAEELLNGILGGKYKMDHLNDPIN
jgi:hypothetical protein